MYKLQNSTKLLTTEPLDSTEETKSVSVTISMVSVYFWIKMEETAVELNRLDLDYFLKTIVPL